MEADYAIVRVRKQLLLFKVAAVCAVFASKRQELISRPYSETSEEKRIEINVLEFVFYSGATTKIDLLSPSNQELEVFLSELTNALKWPPCANAALRYQMSILSGVQLAEQIEKLGDAS